MRLHVRVPDHLGDGVLAIPAVRALARLGAVTLEGPAWAADLYPFATRPADPVRADVAVLLKPSWSAAWRVRHFARRIGLGTDARWPLLTDAVVSQDRHRIAEFAAVARAAGAEPDGDPVVEVEAGSTDLPPGAVLLFPGSRSGAPVRWAGFRTLADRLAATGRAVWFAGGPDEVAAVRDAAGPHPVLAATGIASLARAAVSASAVVGNDSGLSHLAAAAVRGAGGDVAKVHVVFGSTDPARTGPPGATAHSGPRPPCWPCYRKACPFARAAGAPPPCLAVDPDAVLATLHPA